MNKFLRCGPASGRLDGDPNAFASSVVQEGEVKICLSWMSETMLSASCSHELCITFILQCSKTQLHVDSLATQVERIVIIRYASNYNSVLISIYIYIYTKKFST